MTAMTYRRLAITASFFFFFSLSFRITYYKFFLGLDLSSRRVYHIIARGGKINKDQDQIRKEESETMGSKKKKEKKRKKKVGRRESNLFAWGSVRGQGKSDDGMK